MTNLVNENLQAWIESRGTVAYDYDQQQRGLWVNTAAVKAAIDAGPPVETATIEVEDTSENATTSNVVPAMDDPILRIKQLKELLDMGAITDEEFQQKKEELLNKI